MPAQTKNNSPWRPFEDRRRDRDLKRDAVLQAAAQLFVARGYTGTKMNDVADLLNITKPALYNYFKNKEEILFECYRIGHELVEERLALIEASEGAGLDKVRDFIRAYTSEVMTVEFGMCIVRLDDRELSGAARTHVRSRKRKVDRRLRALIRGGIKDGSIAPCDPKTAAFAIAGALNWIGHWYQPDGQRAPARIADEFAAFLVQGLAVRTAPQCAGPRTASMPRRRGRRNDTPGLTESPAETSPCA